ncbi:FumA C-terminus/TtdB family hydratase beta subunit [Candidatus Omnitrophota bacterium]
MDKIKRIQAPLDEKTIKSIKAGEEVLLSGIIYTSRDQAHLRLCEMIKNKEKLPVDLDNQVIYYCGPAPSGNRVMGSCGPTTSGRMDSFTPALLEAGMKGMIGKGRRSGEIARAIKHHHAVYFLAPGGAGAYLSEKVSRCEVVAFEDLGPEAIYKLTVEDFPVVVGIDCKGHDIYARM